MTTFILTGATGLLGRNILFELLKQGHTRRERHTIILVGRSSATASLRQRIETIIADDGLGYIFGAAKPSVDAADRLFGQLSYVEADLAKSDPASAWSGLPAAAMRCDTLIHCAGHTSFLRDPETTRIAYQANVNGALRVVNLAARTAARKLIFVGSAYSAGRMSGRVRPDDADPDGVFANPYQRSKLAAEQVVRTFGAISSVETLVFRPSTICGRLIEPPIGAIPKFDIFYEWAARMLQFKAEARGSWDGILDDWHRLPLRFHVAPESGLHIVPADYCAKLIVHAARGPVPADAFHLAPAQPTPHALYVGRMLAWIKVDGVDLVTARPADMSRFERIFYKTLGDRFDMYVTSPPLELDRTTTHALEREAGVECPVVDRAAFDRLMAYAIDQGLGLPALRRNSAVRGDN